MGAHNTSRPSAGDSRFRMIDVGEKPSTRRRAIARGKIRVGAEAFVRIQERTMPKGDVLALAEVAGITAAKKASDLLPLCHPLSLESVRMHFEFVEGESAIQVVCEAIATAKTGVEMEALAGVNGALLGIYDLTKGVNPALWISDIHLETKEGGKSGFWKHPELPAAPGESEHARLDHLSFGVLTISDRVSRGQAEDRSGPAICELVKRDGGTVRETRVEPDELDRIRAAVLQMAETADVVLTTGGTGVGPRDITPEALATIAVKTVHGIGELLRSRGSAYTPLSWISRSDAYRVKNAIVITLPGSEKAVRQGLDTLIPILKHLRKMIEGGGH